MLVLTVVVSIKVLMVGGMVDQMVALMVNQTEREDLLLVLMVVLILVFIVVPIENLWLVLMVVPMVLKVVPMMVVRNGSDGGA